MNCVTKLTIKILLVIIHGLIPITFGRNGINMVKKNRYVVPYDVWDSAICDFDKAYRAHSAKVEKTNKKGKKNISVINVNLSFEVKKICNNYLK